MCHASGPSGGLYFYGTVYVCTPGDRKKSSFVPISCHLYHWSHELWKVHCTTLYTVHYTVHCTHHCTLYTTLYYTLYYTLHCSLHCTLHSTLYYTLHCTYTILCTILYTIHYTVHHTIHYTVHTLYCELTRIHSSAPTAKHHFGLWTSQAPNETSTPRPSPQQITETVLPSTQLSWL